MRLKSCFSWPRGGGKPRRPGVRRAIAAVEVAVMAPLLGVLMMGLFELSRGMVVKEVLCAAARKGCRTGVLRQYGNSDITNDVTNIMRDNNFDTSKFNPPSVGSITIIVTGPDGTTLSDALDAPPGSTVSVQVTLPTSSINWLSSYFLTPGMMESDTVVMLKQ
jgi:Flp pilus assembly protein TadG